MLNSSSDEPVVGPESVADVLRAVDSACDEFRHAHLLVDSMNDTKSLIGLVFEARIGDAAIRGVDLIEIDERPDQIVSFTVLARPIAGLMTLGACMSEAGSFR